MSKLCNYVKLMRMKHYLKNGLVLLPLFFGRQALNKGLLLHGVVGFLAFCLVSSAVYVFNDLQDVEKDRNHPTKRHRPIASGAVSKTEAWIVLILCLAAAIAVSIAVHQPTISYAALVVYIALNVGYSLSWKNVALLEIIILVFGFLVRLMYGSYVTGIAISGWLYLTVVSISFYLGFGKRRNEWKLQQESEVMDTREVLRHYSESFLNRSMTVFLCTSIVFYSLWAEQQDNSYLLWSVPVVMLLALRYSQDVEKSDASGDPIEMIYGDPVLWLIGIISVAIIMVGVYR